MTENIKKKDGKDRKKKMKKGSIHQNKVHHLSSPRVVRVHENPQKQVSNSANPNPFMKSKLKKVSFLHLFHYFRNDYFLLKFS